MLSAHIIVNENVYAISSFVCKLIYYIKDNTNIIIHCQFSWD